MHNGEGDNFSIDSATGMGFCHSQCGKGWDILGLEMELGGGLPFADAKRRVYELLGREWDEHERDIKETYDYLDEKGVFRYQVVRMWTPPGAKKDFKQRHKENGQWVWNLKGIEMLPYNLHAIQNSGFAFIVEGEACVNALSSHRIAASCNSGGAGKWRDTLNQHFAGKRLCLIPDNDAAGREHVLDVAAKLAPTATRIQILELPDLPEKGDIRDWLQRGGTVEQLRELVKTKARDWHAGFSFAPIVSEEDKWVHSPALIVSTLGGMQKAWDLVGEEGAPTPYEKLTDDLAGGLRKGEVYFLAGRRGSGKTSMLLQFITAALESERGVLMFSLEMRGIDVLHRLVAMEEAIDLAQLRILQKKRKSGEINLHDSDTLNSIELRAMRKTERLSEFPLLVHQKPIVTPDYIVEEAQRLVVSQKIDLVCIDHMQLMGSDDNEKSDYEKFTHISRALKGRVARELNVPVLVASQVTRSHTTDNRAELEVTDMRGSGALEEDAAAVMLLYHDSEDAKRAKLDGRSKKGPVDAWLKLGKNRFGPSPVYLGMKHSKRHTRFDHAPELDPDKEQVA